MNAELSQAEQELNVALDAVRRKADGLEQALRDVDRELETMAVQRRQHELVEEACQTLERLEVEGAAALFWGRLADDGRGAEHIGRVRARIGDFLGQVAAVEERRQGIDAALALEHDNIEILEDELHEARVQEERRKEEWVIEREISEVPRLPALLPWSRGGEDDQRFRRALASSLAVCLLLGALLPQINLPLVKRTDVVEVPERLARLVRQEEERAVPPPVAVEPEPVPQEPEPERTPEPQVAEPTPEEPVPAVAEQPAARERAEQTGILAFRESFSSMAESRPSARLGSDARISSSGEAANARTERSMVATQGAGSGGINVAALSRDTGGGGGEQIGGVEITRVASSIGTEGVRERPTSAGPGPSRTDEEIQIVFDRYKAALYRLYNRELRRDPTLRGQMVLRLTIEPDGTVSLAEVQSSDLNAPDLLEQVVDRVQSFNFGEKDGIPPVTILYPIDFLPAV